MTMLFDPIELRGVRVPNRIALAPMCQFSVMARDGSANDWHRMHYGKFCAAGLGMVMTEATGVSPEARIGPCDLGLYSDANEQALKRIVDFNAEYGSAVMAIQLAHAGQKASVSPPWEGRKPLLPEDGGWIAVAPSAVPVADGWPEPQVLDEAGMAKVKADFVAAARRSDRIGFDVAEVHAAHGYLLHQFLSPVTNKRTDAYGGSLDNRMRFPLEVFAAVREAWPENKPLGIRISATDWIEGGWDLSGSLAFALAVESLGCDFIDVSSGGISSAQKIEAGPGYQVGFAAEIKRAVGMAVITVGQIHDPQQAETILRTGQADMVMLGRGLLHDPHWAFKAADALEAEATYPRQYLRGHRTNWGLRGLGVTGKKA